MLWLFALALLALASPWPAASCVLLLAGYASVAVLDLAAARHGEAPGFFASRRPLKMLIALVSLAVLTAHTVMASPV